METKQCEHLKLKEEEIKNLVSEISVELYNFKEDLRSSFELLEETLQYTEEKIYRLKRHFCPEKFHEVQVSMNELTEMMAKNYFSNTGEVQRMFNPKEESNDNPA